jgi:hypothetical protein
MKCLNASDKVPHWWHRQIVVYEAMSSYRFVVCQSNKSVNYCRLPTKMLTRLKY